MKKTAFFVLLIFCGIQVFSQKTIQVNKVTNDSYTQVLEDGSKLVTFTITGFTSEEQAIEMEQFFRNFRGVEECGFVYDISTGSCYCTGRFYKYADSKYFSFLLQKAGFSLIKLENKNIPVEELKNL